MKKLGFFKNNLMNLLPVSFNLQIGRIHRIFTMRVWKALYSCYFKLYRNDNFIGLGLKNLSLRNNLGLVNACN